MKDLLFKNSKKTYARGMQHEKILGIDPGTAVTGWGCIQTTPHRHTLIAFGALRTSPKAKNEERYLYLFEEMEKVIALHRPDAVSVETQYVDKNVQSALKLGMARGVLMLAATRAGIPIFEYSPTKAKQGVTGSGAASKLQVQKMVQLLLHLPEPPTPEDASDALALAITHAHFSKQLSRGIRYV